MKLDRLVHLSVVLILLATVAPATPETGLGVAPAAAPQTSTGSVAPKPSLAFDPIAAWNMCTVNSDCITYCCQAWGYCPPYSDGGPLCQRGRCYC